MDVIITGLNLAKPLPNKGGSRILAFFDCDTQGFQLNGCAFVRTAREGLTIWPPKIHGREAVRRSVVITDDVLRNAIIQAAREAYEALTGVRFGSQEEDQGFGRTALEPRRADHVPSV